MTDRSAIDELTLRSRFSTLVASGAEAVDPVEVTFINALFARVERLASGARAHLFERIAGRIDRLDGACAARTANDSGGRGRERRRVAIATWLARLTNRARERGLEPPRADLLREKAHSSSQSSNSNEGADLNRCSSLATLLVRDSASAVRAEVVGTRLSAQKSDANGPYNAVAVAARALQLMLDLSPCYMRAFLEHMEELACETPATFKAQPKRGARSQKRPAKRGKKHERPK